MSLEIREIKIVGKVGNQNDNSQNLGLQSKDEINKLLNSMKNEIIEKCTAKVLRKIDKKNRR